VPWQTTKDSDSESELKVNEAELAPELLWGLIFTGVWVPVSLAGSRQFLSEPVGEPFQVARFGPFFLWLCGRIL
jgi:hypothetical protein